MRRGMACHMRSTLFALLVLASLATVPAASAVDAWVYYERDGNCVIGWSTSGGLCSFGEGGGSGGSGVTAGVDLGIIAVCVNDNQPGVAGQCSHEFLDILTGAINLSGTGALPLA